MTGESSHVTCDVCRTLVPSNMAIQLGGKTVCTQCKTGRAREMAGAAPVGSLRYAGFWIRTAAVIVDGLITGIPMWVIMLLLMPTILTNPEGPNAAGAIFQLGFMVVFLFYYTFFHGRFGATLGKMVCRIRVVRSDGSPIGYGRAFGRYWGYLLSGMVCYIGYLMAAFDSEKRSLHDRLCDTRVVYK